MAEVKELDPKVGEDDENIPAAPAPAEGDEGKGGEAGDEADVEVSDKSAKKLIDSVIGAVIPKVKEEVTAILEKTESPIKKNINVIGSGSPEHTKEARLVQYLKAIRDRDPAEIAKYKTMTTDSDSAGGYLVPPPEFIPELQRLEETYGVAMANANIRRTIRTAVQINKKSSGVEIVETAEMGAKTQTQMVLARTEITLRKWAGFTDLSDELEEDAAIDIWNELTQDYALAFSKKQDELVFTDDTYGITKVSGTNAVTVSSGDIADVTFDELNDAIFGVPSQSMQNGKFYMHRKILNILQKIKDVTSGKYVWEPGPNGAAPGTIWGYPVVLTEILPYNNALNTGFIVFGDLKYATLVLRNLMALTVLKEGTVGEVNLGEMDAKALRAVQRFDARVVFPSAFSVIKTAASS